MRVKMKYCKHWTGLALDWTLDWTLNWTLDWTLDFFYFCMLKSTKWPAKQTKWRLVFKVEGREYMPRVESTCRGSRVKSRVEGKGESKIEGLEMFLLVRKKQKPVPLE